MDSCGLVMRFWLATAIPWLQKLSVVEVGQASIVCFWALASRVRTSAHCVSSLGASELRLFAPLGVRASLPWKVKWLTTSPLSSLPLRWNPFWVKKKKEFLILSKLIYTSVDWWCSLVENRGIPLPAMFQPTCSSASGNNTKAQTCREGTQEPVG